MSLLSLVQDFCRANALAVPTAVMGTTDTQIAQIQQIFFDMLGEIQTESKFNVTTGEVVFTTVPRESQGTFAQLGALGFQYPIFETFYDRTLKRPLIGPLDEREWQAMKALPNTGTAYRFRVWQNALFLNPIPTAPFSDIAFEYSSRYTTYDGDYSAANSGALQLKNLPTKDNDFFVFHELLLKRGLAFRWKQIKGLPYQEDETQFYRLLNNYIARDKVKRRINVAEDTPTSLTPGVFVSSNTWPVHN